MSRRLAREVALRTLFQLDKGHLSREHAFNFALETTPLAAKDEEFAQQLVDQALTRQAESDEIIAARSVDWSIERLARVDRAILRLCLGELLSDIGTPAGAAINEAVELADKYSSAESGRFINGILGSFQRGRTDE